MSDVDPQGGVERSSATPAGSLDSLIVDGATACPKAPSPSTADAAAFDCAHAKVDPQVGVERSSATPAGSLDSPTADGATACPRAPSPTIAAIAIFDRVHATAPWPGVAFPRQRATYIPVGGAAAAIMSPTPPRYKSGVPASATTSEGPAAATICATISERPAAATISEAPAAATKSEAPATKTASGISGHEKLGLLSASSAMIGDGLTKIWGKALIIGVTATDMCNWFGVPILPLFFKTHVRNLSEWSQLPGFFKGLSCVLEGASEVFEGSSQAFGAIRSYIPSAPYSQLKSGKAHAPYATGSYPQQGIHTLLSYHMIKRSYVDSVLIVQDNNGSRRSPKKVLPRVETIRTLEELKHRVAKFKNGEPVHLIDVSEQDVPLDLALDFWDLLLVEGATALLRRDSNLCRMSKMAYSLSQEKKHLESQLITLNKKVDEIKHSMTIVSDMLANTKPKSAGMKGHARSIDFSSVSGNQPSASITTLVTSKEKKVTSLSASQENEFKPAATNTNISDSV